MAIPRKAKVSTLPSWPQMNIHHFTDARHELGVTTVTEGKNGFLIYDMEKTVVDIVFYREKVGIEETKEILVTYLDRTRIPISIDIGFDDVVYPDRVKMEFPVLLDTEAPEIYVYSITSVISEKFEAIVLLGNANSRYKDFYDIYISRLYLTLLL